MKKLKEIYESLLEVIEITCEIQQSEKSAYELAAELGYEKFLARIEYNLGVEEMNSSLYGIKIKEITLAYPIELNSKTKAMKIITTPNYFGEEEFKTNEAIVLLRKAGYLARIEYSEQNQQYELVVSKKEKLFEDRVSGMVDKVSDASEKGKEQVGRVVKKTLNNLCDWANKKL